MGMGSVPYNIDERYFQEWFETGWAQLIHYLTGWSMFDAWCLDHEQEEQDDRQ